MALRIIPVLGKGKSVKGMIISVLSLEWPLTPRKIYTEVRKNGINVTYQAVYKTLKEMTEEGILDRSQKAYEISRNWIREFRVFFDHLSDHAGPSYLPSLSDFIREGEIRSFSFQNLEELELYRKRLQWEFISDPDKTSPYCSEAVHLKSPIIFSEKSLSMLDLVMRTKTLCYLLIKSSTPVDKWCAAYYTNKFVNVKTGAKCAESCDTMVLDDIVVQCFIPDSILKEMDAIYKKSVDMDHIDIPRFYIDVYKKQADFQVVVQKNRSLAHTLRNRIINRFNNPQQEFLPASAGG